MTASSSPPLYTLLHAVLLGPLLWWRVSVSENLLQDLAHYTAMFLCMFLIKFVDKMVDTGLTLFATTKGDHEIHLTAFLMISISVGLILTDDFSATFFTGLTLDSLVGGKLDCIQFQLAGIVSIGLYWYRYSLDSFSYTFTDMVAIAVLGALEEHLHDAHEEKWKKIEENECNTFSKCVHFFHDHRLFSVTTIIPLLFWRDHYEAVPLMMAQVYGYKFGYK